MSIEKELTESISEVSKNLIDEGNRIASGESDKVIKRLSGLTKGLTLDLNDLENKDGEIPTYRINTASKIVDDLEDDLLAELMDGFDEALSEVIKKSSDSVTSEIAKYSAVTALIGKGLTRDSLKDVEEDVEEFILKREIEGVNVSARLLGVAAILISEIRKSVRYGIILKESVPEILKRIETSLERVSWQINRIFLSEMSSAVRAIVAFIGDSLGIIKGVKIIDNRGRHKNHHRHKCYIYAEDDKYGMGKGVYKVTDSYIFDPHPQCSAYFELVFKDGVLKGGNQ